MDARNVLRLHLRQSLDWIFWQVAHLPQLQPLRSQPGVVGDEVGEQPLQPPDEAGCEEGPRGGGHRQ